MSVWLEVHQGLFRVEYYLHGVELRRRDFGSYREAFQFARRKASKRGAVIDNTPEHLQQL